MWIWSHLVFGYLGYLLVRPAAIRRIDGPVAIAVILGSVFPDVVDKPLAWWLGVLPSGRSFAHSLITLVLVSAVVWAFAEAYDRREIAIGWTVGYASHLLGDVAEPLYHGRYDEITFLLWPILPAPPYTEPANVAEVVAFLLVAPFTPRFLLELVVATVVGFVCFLHFVFRSEW